VARRGGGDADVAEQKGEPGMEPPLLRTLTDHRHEVCSVAFSPTGLLATDGA
jgi:hypothetical protein